MERRFEARLDEMMDQAEVSPELLKDLLPRLNQFVLPFVGSLLEPEQKQHAVEYMSGLVSGLRRKTSEGIAYLHDQERQGIQKFIGYVPWDHQPLLATLASQVGQELGEADGVIVFDPSAFAKEPSRHVLLLGFIILLSVAGGLLDCVRGSDTVSRQGRQRIRSAPFRGRASG